MIRCVVVEQLKNLMVVGVDTYHDSAKKGRSVGAFVASMNQRLTRYYSNCGFQSSHEELQNNLCTFMLSMRVQCALIFLGHLYDLINLVKMSVREYVRTSTMKHNAATNQIVLFVKVDESFTTI